MSQQIGSVVSISGSSLRGQLDDLEAYDGPSIEIGDLIKIRAGHSFAFGLVSGMSLGYGGHGNGAEHAYIDVDLFGEAVERPDTEGWRFERGVATYPGLRAPMFTASPDDLARIYRRPDSPSVRIGVLHQDNSLPVHLLTDDLLGKHFAVLGTTGSGKSCAVAVILKAILDSHRNGHIVLLDPHDEYRHVFGDIAEVVTPETLRLPYWFLSLEELSVILCGPGSDTREAERAILKDAVIYAKRTYAADNEDQPIDGDSPVPFRLNALTSHLNAELGRLEKSEGATPYLRLLARLDSLRSDSRYRFMFSGLTVVDDMSAILSNLLRIPVEGKPLTILCLSGLPSEIVDVIVSLLARTVFNVAVWTPREDSVPILLVCEEAHRYVPRNSEQGFAPTRRALSQIAKEGRKYGVSLCLVTQRPSEISESVLTQCNTLFGLRMCNAIDQAFIEGALPENAAGLLNTLPALRTQQAIVVGEGVSAPLRVRFDDLPYDARPRSATASFSAAWAADVKGQELLDETVDRWRRHVRF